MKLSYGFIETRGLIAAIEAADAMAKAAHVKLRQTRQVGSALITVIVEGELGACQAAVEAGKIVAERVGELVSAHIIAHPFGDTELMLTPPKVPHKQTDVKPAVSAPPVEKASPGKAKPAVKAKPSQPEADASGAVTAPGLLSRQKTKPAPATKPVNERILSLIRKNLQGLTVQQVCDRLKIDPAQARIALKQLMDDDLIEKIRHNFFPLNPGDNQ
jgi:microcompartment protein CcmL/EutN